MSDETQEERASLYALELLDATEAAQLEAEMRADPALALLVQELQHTSAHLAYCAGDANPHPRLRNRILGAIRKEKTLPFPPRLGWAIAASLALTCSWLAYERSQLQSQVSVLKQNATLAEQKIAKLAQKDALSELKIATLTSRLGGGGPSVGAVAWSGEFQRGFLTLEKMPRLDPNQDYQLWVIDPKYPNPVDGGIVRVDDSGNASLTFTVQVPVRSADKFAISRERRGGVPKAEGPIVMLSN